MGAKAQVLRWKENYSILLSGDPLPAVLVGKVFPNFSLTAASSPFGGREPIPNYQPAHSHK